MNLASASSYHTMMDNGSSSIPWPAMSVSIVADITISVLIILKLIAYAVDVAWMVGPGGHRLRDSYMMSYHKNNLPRAYADDIELGSPRLFSRKSDLDAARGSLNRIFGLIFKAPSLVIAASVLSISAAAYVPAFLAVIVASLIALLIVFAIGYSLCMRLILGPYDQLTPALSLPESVSRRLYQDSSTLGPYVLVLISMSIAAFTAVYANIAVSVPGAFSANQTVDPIQWLYFTATVASTVGFGDIHASSDVGRIFVLTQLSAGSLLVTWVIAIFFGQPLPAKDPIWETNRQAAVQNNENPLSGSP